MATITARDAEQILRFVASAEELGDEHPVTPEVLQELGKLVEADEVAYCEQDRVRERIRYAAERLGDDPFEPPVPYWEIAAEHPICSRHNTGRFEALKLSDFVTLKELRRSRIYALWFRPWGMEHELNVAIPSPPWHTKTFLFDRGAGRRDFTERDRRVLDLLQPHLGRLWHAARVRRQLRAALESIEGESEQDGRAVVLVGHGGLIEFASPAARRLLLEYFGDQGQREIPTSLSDWFASGSPIFALDRAEHRLTVSRSGSTLLLEETHDELGLTARERQVLAWVARGKTNPEVAEILWVTPSTVRKHLENIYAKLGVHTRTAAVTRFLGALGD